MSRVTRGARLALLLAAVGVLAGAATAAVRHGTTSRQLRQTDKVVICHATGNGGWVQLDTPVSQIIGNNGHADHPDDIIPPFTYEGGSFPGLNWPSGIPTWENGCVSPTPPPPRPIGVFVACGATNGTTYDAVFGYNSPNAADVSIAIGDSNNVQPGGPGRGQPTVFHHGNVSSAFTVAGIPIADAVTWSVTFGGSTSTATSNFADCGQPPPVEPHVSIFVRCVSIGPTTFTALFGYTNPGQVAANVPIGDANNVNPGGPDRGQPESFLPGSFDNEFGVSAIPIGTTVTWTLTSGGSTATAIASDSDCGEGPPPTPDPVTPFVQCVQNHDSTYDVTFGYSNPNADPVTLPIPDRNSVSPGGPNRNQPETFASGVENAAFTVTGIPEDQSVTWTLSTNPPDTVVATATASFETKCSEPPETPKIGIFVRCVTNHDGTFDATFGYQNDNLSAVSIPVGDANRFAPGDIDRGQTTNFQPGNVQEAFTVDGIPSAQDLVWTLTSNGTRTATASAHFETKCSDPPPPAKPIGIFVTCVAKHGSTYDAVFGYENDNTVAETIDIGPGNAFDPPPIDRGQPTVFVPGRTVDAVTVPGIPSTQSLTWTVAYDGTRTARATLGSSATANPSSPPCPTTPPKPEPPDPPGPQPPDPPRPLGIFATCVLNHGATYDAVFGYVNLNVGDVVIPIGARNFVRPGADGQGQPETFRPGFVAGAFAIRGVPVSRTLTWTIKFGDQTRVATSSATLPRKCPTAPIGPIPDLKITKKARPLVMYVGHRVVFTIVVTNIGRRPVQPVVVTDVRLDPRVAVLSTSTSLGACRVAASVSASTTTACGRKTLVPGQSATVRIVGRALIPGRSRDVATTIFSRTLDATPRNNVARARVTILARPHPRPKPPFTG